MRFADLLGEPDDPNESASSTPEPAASAAPEGSTPGASGSLGGGTAPTEDDITRWFTADEAPIEPADAASPAPTTAPVRGQALAEATGATGAADAAWDDTPAEPAAAEPIPSRGVARDDLMPARPAHHGRKRR